MVEIRIIEKMDTIGQNVINKWPENNLNRSYWDKLSWTNGLKICGDKNELYWMKKLELSEELS